MKKTPAVESFIKATRDVPDFRNYVQHMEEAVSTVAATGRPILGTLSWLVPRLHEGQPAVGIVVVGPGTAATTKGIPMVNPVGKSVTPPADHFELSTFNSTISLTKLIEA